MVWGWVLVGAGGELVAAVLVGRFIKAGRGGGGGR
jgi:hypothetical protein